MKRLIKDIDQIKIAIIAFGDYYDGRKLLKKIDLTNDVARLQRFVDTAGSTHGEMSD